MVLAPDGPADYEPGGLPSIAHDAVPFWLLGPSVLSTRDTPCDEWHSCWLSGWLSAGLEFFSSDQRLFAQSIKKDECTLSCNSQNIGCAIAVDVQSGDLRANAGIVVDQMWNELDTSVAAL